MFREVYATRIAFVFLVFVSLFAPLTMFLHQLQVVRHRELSDKARRIYTSSRSQTGERGRIYDINGNLLVGNLNCRDVLVEPGRIPETRREEVLATLSRVLRVDRAVLDRRFASGAVEVVARRAAETAVAALLAERKLPGVRFVDCTRRSYPKGRMCATVIGFTDAEGNGAYGLERRFNDILAPSADRVTYERDRKGRPLGHDSIKELEPPDGHDIYLTIDEPIQDAMERELAALGEEFRPTRAFAIMANPATGAIMGMAQWPEFDPNRRDQMDGDRWRNHMVSDVYDPGSTMKSITIAGALDFGTVTMNSVFFCENGRWYYGGRSLRDSGHRYGNLDVATILQKSSNIGTAKIALAMGESKLYQVLRRFGFGERTGLGMADESKGILRSPQNWDRLSITRFPIGQGVSVTAPQMVQAYCALANGGQMMQLRLVDRIARPGASRPEHVPPQPKHIAVRPRAAYDVVTAMIRVTGEGGTARRAAVEGYEVAGKTGTSQKCIDGSYVGHDKYVASFIGFVPARDPAFVLLVVADEPSNGKYYGGTVCGPTFRRIAEETLRYLNVAPVMARGQ